MINETDINLELETILQAAFISEWLLYLMAHKMHFFFSIK